MNRVVLAALPLSLALVGAAFAAPPPVTATQPMAAPQSKAVSYRRDKPLAERMTHALNILEANGYGDFSNFRANGKNFAATVTEQGKPMSLVVDPNSNQVSRS